MRARTANIDASRIPGHGHTRTAASASHGHAPRAARLSVCAHGHEALGWLGPGAVVDLVHGVEAPRVIEHKVARARRDLHDCAWVCARVKVCV